MNGEWGVRAGVALLVAAVAGVAAWERTRAPSAPPPPRLEVRADLDPRTHLFGDPVTARVDVELNGRVVDPGSVQVLPRFWPYTVEDSDRDASRAGNAVVLRHRFALLCLAGACAPRGAPLELVLRPVRVEYRLRSGATRALTVAWPTSYLATRVSGVQLPTDPRASLPWRFPAAPPPASYRVSPALVAGALYGAGVLLALVAAVLLAPEVRRLLGLAVRRPDPLAGLPPLERALALLERAVASGRAADQRKALDRLARELGRRGDDDLAGAARRLAWSSAAPGDEVSALTGAVARARGGRA